MRKKSGKLFIISGTSQVGKNTVARKLSKYRSLNLVKIVTVTTRPRRHDDKRATYHFVTFKKFRAMIKNGTFLEWAKVHQDYYGTPKQQTLKVLRAGQNVILVIDVQGALKIKEAIPSVVTIFITAESNKELKRRIFESKHIPDSQKNTRWRSTIRELRASKQYDHIVINRWGKLLQTVKQVKGIIANTL